MEPLSAEEQELWQGRAKRLLEEALYLIDSEDVLPQVSAVQACLRISASELDPAEMDGYRFPGEEEDESACTCPPDLRERGGFRSTCRVHGAAGTS